MFPSKTDTFGLVLLEALASGLPVAAFPVTGPRDVIGSAPVGVLSDDLRKACLEALDIPREACIEFAGDTPGRPRRACSSTMPKMSALPMPTAMRSNLWRKTRISPPELT